MTVWENLKSDERKAIEELQHRYEKILPPDIKDDETLFYRFLKARNFDLDKAETLLKKHLDWRKASQVDTFLQTFQPKEVWFKYIEPCFIAFDKDGDSVLYDPVGRKDPKEILNSLKMTDLMKHYVWMVEKYLVNLKNENEKTGRRCFQLAIIYDLENYQLAYLSGKACINMSIQLSRLMQDNYPERMKSIFVINAPAYFTVFFAILKKFMSHEMQQKVRVFGNNGWKEALLKAVDKEVLPAALGGNRTDPDGNPLCESFIRYGGRIPPQYFLSPEERYFKDNNRVKSVVVPYADNIKIPVKVKEYNSLVQWEFEIKSKDIGFGLYFQKSEDELEEVLPIQKFVTPDGTETGSFKPLSVGTYIIIFDNSYSRLTSKEVFYCITVQAPN